MGKYSDILHEGIVTKTDGNSATVLLSPDIACAGCKAGGSCSLSGDDTKLLTIENISGVHPGEKVVVSMTESQGYSALLLGYIFPLIIVLVALTVSVSLSIQELISGLISVTVLIPYYIILYAFRSVIGRKFSFKLLTKPSDEFNSTSDHNQS